MDYVRKVVPDAVLVVPGNRTPLRAKLEERARTLGVEGAVAFPGWIEAADLEGLYRAARCFAFPSLREGFGLPILEAMIRGLPVACAPESAMLEVAGEAALYFDPRSPESIGDAIVRLLLDQPFADELAAAGLDRQRRFTWQRTAELTLDVYERAMSVA
jgi:glycosyltransferase involved in cell wall biosynthesis